MKQDFEQQFLDLQQQFIAGLVQRKHKLLLLQKNYTSLFLQEDLENLYREVHNLTGSSGLYQVDQLAQIARHTEDLIRASLESTTSQRQQPSSKAALEQQLAVLVDVLNSYL